MTDRSNGSATLTTPGGPRPATQVFEVPPGQAVTAEDRAKPAIVSDLVVTPGGPRPRFLVHEMRAGEAVVKAGAVFKKLNLADRTTSDLVQGLLRPGDLPALGSGWITYGAFTNAGAIGTFRTTWTVPPPPKTQSGQLIYLFNGLQDNPVTHILQPVLQWGTSPDGGGNGWAVASWFVDSSGNAFKTPLVKVNEGDVLTGVMTLTSQFRGTYNYTCAFEGIAGTSLPVLNINALVMAVETLECYGIAQCTDYPSTDRTRMTAIELIAGNVELAPTWIANDSVTDCGQQTVVVSNASPGGEVDLYYGSAAATHLIGGTRVLLESSFRADASKPGNFEALLLQGTNLVHYWRDNSDANLAWHEDVTVSGITSSAACLIESSYRADGSKPGNFEALVLEGSKLVHYWRDNSSAQLPWHRGVTVSGIATGTACFLEGGFRGDASKPGNFEALVLEGKTLVHYWRDNSDPNLPWHRGVVVSAAATGAACFIEGSFRGNASKPGNFEALVLEGRNLVHYWRDNSDPNLAWHRGVTVSSVASGPACFFEGDYRGNASKPGNFEALVFEGTNLVHYWRDNSDPNLAWHRGVTVSGGNAGPACFIEGAYRANASTPGNFEALVQESGNLVHYWRDDSNPALAWHRGVVV